MIQILLSVACIAFGIASTVTSHSDKNISLPITYSIVGLTGADVWCGVIFLVISFYHLCTIYKSDKQARVSFIHSVQSHTFDLCSSLGTLLF